MEKVAHAPEIPTAAEGQPSLVSDQELRDLFSDFGRMRRRVLLFIRQLPESQRTMLTDEAEPHFMALAQLMKNLLAPYAVHSCGPNCPKCHP